MPPTYQTDDVRIDELRPLIPPAILMEELPATEDVCSRVAGHREQVARILAGDDDRLIAVVGPCSIHDTKAALEYAQRLAGLAEALRDDLLVVMRVYFEKPRTIIGWKGLINDPHLDGSFAINEGLRLARRFLLDVIALGLPSASEFLDPISPQFYADLVAWGAIGARTSESQVHRELASGLSMPVGFKNGTDGGVQLAIDGILSAAHPHHFLSVTKQGVAAIVSTRGNPECHVILRGGANGPNYDAASIAAVAAKLEKAGLPPRIMVDCSHANSEKNHENQPRVAAEVGRQVAGGERAIVGVMVESFLVDGNQDHTKTAELVYGKSITDKCLDWERTEALLRDLADSVRKRRG
ncbi:MAG: 3-deoxy-7-phosphoheptulonate synthase [Myxococcales bacterium]|nr:3-deoxy-7-phosphoheptulonate synthase [Myxococcales bacterium]